MKVQVESIGTYQKQISFQVAATEVREKLDSAYKRLSQRAKVPGFRPGKVPRLVLEKRFGAGVESDVADQLVQTAWRDTVKNYALEPISQPSLTARGEVSHAQGFQFTILVEVKPEITLSTWTGLDVVFPDVVVTDEEVAAAVRARLEGQSRLETVTGRPVQAGDLVLVELTAKSGDEVKVTEPGTMIRIEADPYYPGIEALLIGAEIGASVSGSVSFPATARAVEVAGQTLEVSANVLAIQHNQVPELDDALATELGYEGGADGMRSALHARIFNDREAMARNQARANLLEVLIAANRFDVPASMTEESLGMLVKELKYQQAYRTGRDPQTIAFSDAQMADLRMRSVFASKAALILDWVAKHEKLEVTDADLEARYATLAEERGQTLEAVKGYYGKGAGLDEVRQRIIEEKTLDWLLERANLVSAAAAAAAAPAKAAPALAAPAPAPAAAAPEVAAPEVAAPAAAAPAAAADLSVLELAIGKLKEAVASGAHDADLAALLAAETGGKNRKGAVAALEARIAEIG